MKRLRIVLWSFIAVILVSCGTTNTVPITGRQQNLMVSDGEILSLSTQQYQEFMKSAKPSTNAANTAMVELDEEGTKVDGVYIISSDKSRNTAVPFSSLL